MTFSRLIAYLLLLMLPTFITFLVWVLTFRSFDFMWYIRTGVNVGINSAWATLITLALIKTLNNKDEL